MTDRLFHLTRGDTTYRLVKPRNRRERRDMARLYVRFHMSPERAAANSGLPLAKVRQIQRGYSRAIYRSFRANMYAHQADFYRLAYAEYSNPLGDGRTREEVMNTPGRVTIPRKVGFNPALALPFGADPHVKSRAEVLKERLGEVNVKSGLAPGAAVVVMSPAGMGFDSVYQAFERENMRRIREAMTVDIETKSLDALRGRGVRFLGRVHDEFLYETKEAEDPYEKARMEAAGWGVGNEEPADGKE